VDRGPDRLGRRRGGDDDDLDGVAGGAQAPQQRDPALARQPDVQQQEIGVQRLDHLLGLRRGRRRADRAEARDAGDEAAVQPRHHAVVLHHEHAPVSHGSSPGRSFPRRAG
jgi:hypothetical protein